MSRRRPVVVDGRGLDPRNRAEFARELVALGGGIFVGCLSPRQLRGLAAFPRDEGECEGEFRWVVLDSWLPEVHDACVRDRGTR